MPQNKSELEIDGKAYTILTKKLTFFDVQAVAPLLAQGSLDFSAYWRHAFTKWLEFYDAKDQCAEYPDIEGLSPEVGQRLAALLPEPAQVMEWLGFLEDVRTLSIEDAKQLLYWAQAMQGEEQAVQEAVYLGYDVIPELE